MKKAFYFLLCLCACSYQEAGAHEATADLMHYTLHNQRNREAETGGYPNNFIKLNLTSLCLGNISLQYERALSRHFSAALGYRWMPKGRLPMRNTVLNLLEKYADLSDQKDNVRNILHSATLGAHVITPELRFYTGQNNKGFYLGLFGRIENYSAHIPSINFEIDKEPMSATMDIRYNAIGIGLQLGVQFRLPRNFYLDWWISGPYITHSDLHLNAYNYQVAPEDFKKFEEEFKGNIIIDNKYFTANANVGPNASTAKATGNLPGIRGMGLCLAYRF